MSVSIPHGRAITFLLRWIALFHARQKWCVYNLRNPFSNLTGTTNSHSYLVGEQLTSTIQHAANTYNLRIIYVYTLSFYKDIH